jgi:hypothetical protein
MDKHCPVFVLECAATFTCLNFLTGTLPLDLICKKVCDHINKEYKELLNEDLRDVAETFLRCLADANVEEADVVLKHYAFERLYYRRNGKERGWDSLMWNPMKGLKSLQLDLKLIRRHFQAFIFRYKQNKKHNLPADWEINKFEKNDFLKALGEIEFSPFDIMDQA